MDVKTQLARCDVAVCRRELYRNRLIEVEAGGVIYLFCPDCFKALLDNLADRGLLRNMVRTALEHSEQLRILAEGENGSEHPGACCAWCGDHLPTDLDSSTNSAGLCEPCETILSARGLSIPKGIEVAL